MRYVILRDDDTNALTPPECLERLYRPFLERGLPVNLALIPDVGIDTRGPDGQLEGYLAAGRRGVAPGNGSSAHAATPTVPIADSPELVRYLHRHSGYHIVQHGCHHSPFEFDSENVDDICARLDRGTRLLQQAGFAAPETFVAPYDRLSKPSLKEVGKRFRVLSTGWFEWRRVPPTWWPRYAFKKLRGRPHWRVGQTALLSHPGCLLSYRHPYSAMLEQVKQAVTRLPLTVLVTHWWEYFRGGTPDSRFIEILHQTARWLKGQ